MEEINQNPTLSTVPKRITFFSLRKLFLILAGILILAVAVFASYWLGRLQQPPLTLISEEIPVCQVDADCVVAIDLSAACCGVGVHSKEQLQRNKNLVPYEEGKDYSRPNSGVVCKICSVPEAVICDIGSSVNVCRAATKIEVELSYEARKAVNLAKEDLAKNLNIDIRKIALNRVQEVTWPDSSMGCSKPEEGVSLPVVTPGYQIFLQAYGVVYDYRAGKGGEQGYYIRPCSTQLAIDCTKDSDCSQGLVCVGRGPAQPSVETPGVCLSQKQSQGMQ